MDGSSELARVLVMFFAVFMIILAVLFLFALANYIMTAIAVYKIAKRRGIDHAFLAWIPIANTYLFAELIGTNVKVGKVTIPHYPWIYTGILCLGGLLSGTAQSFLQMSSYGSTNRLADRIADAGANLSYSMMSMTAVIIGGVIALIILVVRIYTMYRVFSLFKGNTVLYTVLGGLISLALPIILLILSGKPFADEPEAVPAPYSA